MRRQATGAAGEVGAIAMGHLGVDLALGLALLAQALWLLALAGWLNRGTVLALILAVHALALLPGGAWREPGPAWRARLWGIGRWRALAGLVLFVPLFVLALYPPTGFDETLYHLPFARAFAETGHLALLWDLRVPIFPQLAELLFAAAYLGCGETGAHLVSLLATLATAALVVEWGRRRFSPAAGWLGAAIFLGNPITLHLATSGYIDSILTLFVVAAWVLAEEGLAAGAEARLAPFFLAGICAGTAAGTKYLGLFFVAALAVEVFLRAPAARRIPLVLALALAAGVALAPTYLRLWLVMGNPLFPFLPSVFGSTRWDPAPMQGSLTALARPLLVRWPLLFWDVLFNRPAVGWQPPFAPWLLLGSPLLLRGLRRDGRLRTLCAVPLVWSIFFLVLPADARYLMPVVPFVSLALGVVAAEAGAAWLRRRSARPAWLAPALVLLLASPGWAYAGYRLLRQGALPRTPSAREAYLARRLSMYGAFADLNRRFGAGYALYNLGGENLRYFVRGRMLGDWTNRHPYDEVVPLLGDAAALDRKLESFGATHLLLPRSFDPAFRRGAWQPLFRPIYRDADCTVYERLRRGRGGGNPRRGEDDDAEQRVR